MALDVGIASHPAVAVLACVYAASLATSLAPPLYRQRGLAHAGTLLMAVAFFLNLGLIGWSWISYGRPPFKTLFETMVFYPMLVAAVTLLLVRLHQLYILVPFSAAVCLSGLVYALWRPDLEVVNLPPALQSAWFVPHVVTYFISYAALFASCALAVIELVRARWMPERPSYEGHANRVAAFGLVALTLGLIMGGMWGKFAWGDYWSWDPKENWALVTWLAYLIYFHLRRMDGWQGRRGMALLAGAYAAVVFTYLGMNLLPDSNSLHVYQGN
jgi:ABC-type transport system involved in cytochrome c biogenesis permease subunit